MSHDRSAAETPRYRETLRVPASWWLMGAGLVVSVAWCFYVALPWPAAVVAGGVALVLVAAALLSYGSARVVLDAGGLTAGRARLPWQYIGAVEPLDAAATRQLAGPDADARAFLLLRAYCGGAVRVGVDDMADPAPYWLVSTRHPQTLAARLGERRVRD